MDTKPTHIEFALAKITTEQFATIEGNLNNECDIQININFRFAADDEKRLIGVFGAFAFESNQKPFILIEAGCHFSIKQEAWDRMLDKDANILTVPKEFLQHLVMLTVGTARGILHAKTENTCFNRYLLPTINVVNIVKENSEFKFNKEEA